MKRTAGVLVLLAALGGCVSNGAGPYRTGTTFGPSHAGCSCGSSFGQATVPGVQGPWGQPVAMAAPWTSAPPLGEAAAKAMLSSSVPLDQVQQAGYNPAGGPGVIRANGSCPPGGCPPGVMPPPGGLSPPGIGAMPAVPGMMAPGAPLQMGGPKQPAPVAAIGALTGPTPGPFPAQRTEVYFTGPLDMKVSWYAPTADGKGAFSANSLDAPGRYNFLQAAIYRLKLTNIPNRPELELYPTLEVVPANHKTSAFLAHSAVPVTFTDYDLDQVAAGNYVVKVIYLPDPQFQNLAATGPDELVSSQLEPGVDPIAEACRRGSILLVVRLGNIHLELAHSPAMDAPSPYQAKPLLPHGAGMPGPGMLPPGVGMGPGGPGLGGPGPMGPYGMGPGGPMMPPGGPMMPPQGNPALTAPPTMPAFNGPEASPPAPTPATPVGKLPAKAPVQPVQFKTPAELASQPLPPPPMPATMKAGAEAGR